MITKGIVTHGTSLIQKVLLGNKMDGSYLVHWLIGYFISYVGINLFNNTDTNVKFCTEPPSTATQVAGLIGIIYAFMMVRKRWTKNTSVYVHVIGQMIKGTKAEEGFRNQLQAYQDKMTEKIELQKNKSYI